MLHELAENGRTVAVGCPMSRDTAVGLSIRTSTLSNFPWWRSEYFQSRARSTEIRVTKIENDLLTRHIGSSDDGITAVPSHSI